MMNCNRLLVPIDFSKEAELALEWAVKLAREEKAPSIYLLHVLPYVVDPTYLTGWTVDLVGLRWDEAKKDLAQWREKVPSTIPCFPLLQKGSVAKEIERACNEKAIDLVIMTTRERRGVARVIKPNASEETVRLAPCPVLVLHLNKKTTASVAKG